MSKLYWKIWGNGLYLWNKDKYYEGFWKNDKQNGFGLYYKNGKKIKEENEKQEISRYIKKNAKVKKLIRDQYKKNISTDSEKEEKDKKEELALQIIIYCGL